ncbi:hypothetical protein ABB37_07812 [Leptomonas pyrrhocoris]|uniref:Uncharacterized protein n=1 Tax=Leptomonas pyrrhocoris TaxID=157538 RepID=A0A0M9FUW7_LEPPY|nr:hypothetical protein ABB37_07812 [Leptomonas pyrrhocoris]KPA76513.1 hypothetical protein ABB37_07812 [Leptomonas pyrrhocoris]|eukprot:XP_015654952.1 hypothetical protein ABB37_07812 [Leptomonas pyrrhocoris]
MDCVALLTEKVDLRDYPDYAACTRANELIGATLCEYYAATGMRYTVPLCYAASIAYFYLYHRPRLSFADRPLSKLHHVFFPSAGYSTPLGMLGGIGVGLHQCAQDVSPAGLRATTQREKADAVMAASQYTLRRHAAEAQLRAEQSFVSKALVGLHLHTDPVREELSRLGLGEAKMPWESLLVPHGVLWTAAHSTVHDASRYKDYRGPVEAPAATPEVSSSSAATVGVEKQPKGLHSRPTPYFTKLQTDALVSRAATLRSSPDEDRWMRTTGRCSAYGIFTMLLAWNSGNALFRLSMGLGLGVTVGTVVSATRLDQMFVHL